MTESASTSRVEHGLNVNVKNQPSSHRPQLLTWLTNDNGYNARRLGIMYIGYNAKIWGAYRVSEDMATTQQQQRAPDHALPFTWNGATARTSFWDRHCRRAEDYDLPPVRGTTSPDLDASEPNTACKPTSATRVAEEGEEAVAGQYGYQCHSSPEEAQGEVRGWLLWCCHCGRLEVPEAQAPSEDWGS